MNDQSIIISIVMSSKGDSVLNTERTSFKQISKISPTQNKENCIQMSEAFSHTDGYFCYFFYNKKKTLINSV